MSRYLTILALLAAPVTLHPQETGRVSHEERNRFLFLAVFESLLEDGMPDGTAAKVLEQTPDGRYVNFVYGCPICIPVIEAFRAFSKRHDFYYARKGEPNFRTSSVPEVVAAALGGPSLEDRRRAVGDYIKGSVHRRLKRSSLSDAERAAILESIAEGVKQGMELLRTTPNPAMKECPSCVGAEAGARP